MKLTEVQSQLGKFIKMNLFNSNFIDSYYREDIDIIYDEKLEIKDGETFLNRFKSKFIKPKVLRNFQLVENRQKIRSQIKKPSTGDVFIDELGNNYRLVEIYDGHYQFCFDGSFYMSKNGYASMSGGLAFNVIHKGKEVYSIKIEELQCIEEKQEREFWFFIDDFVGGGRGIYFYCQVKVFEANN